MPRKKPVLSDDEKSLIIFVREYIEYLLRYDRLVDILSSIERNSVEKFGEYLRKLDQPANYNV